MTADQGLGPKCTEAVPGSLLLAEVPVLVSPNPSATAQRPGPVRTGTNYGINGRFAAIRVQASQRTASGVQRPDLWRTVSYSPHSFETTKTSPQPAKTVTLWAFTNTRPII